MLCPTASSWREACYIITTGVDERCGNWSLVSCFKVSYKAFETNKPWANIIGYHSYIMWVYE